MAQTMTASAVTGKKQTKRKRPSSILDTRARDVLKIALIGLCAGILIWLVEMALRTWVVDPLFCRTPDTYSICQNAVPVAFIAALVIVGVLSISVMSILKVYRPMLIVLAALASIWAISPWLNSHTWWVAVLWSAGLVAFSYILYGLVVRIKRFGFTLLCCVVLVIAFQFLMRYI